MKCLLKVINKILQLPFNLIKKIKHSQTYKIGKIFQNIYDNSLWDSPENANESRSGIGSILSNTIAIRKAIVQIISDFQIKEMLDISCGDWNWMKEIAQDLPSYTGLDVTPSIIKVNKKKYKKENINFINIDALSFLQQCKDKQYDLILARHTLEHLPLDYNIALINEIKRCSKYALINSKNLDTTNLATQIGGYSSINLLLSPYVEILGEPIVKIDDRCVNEAAGISYTGLYSF